MGGEVVEEIRMAEETKGADAAVAQPRPKVAHLQNLPPTRTQLQWLAQMYHHKVVVEDLGEQGEDSSAEGVVFQLEGL